MGGLPIYTQEKRKTQKGYQHTPNLPKPETGNSESHVTGASQTHVWGPQKKKDIFGGGKEKSWGDFLKKAREPYWVLKHVVGCAVIKKKELGKNSRERIHS